MTRDQAAPRCRLDQDIVPSKVGTADSPSNVRVTDIGGEHDGQSHSKGVADKSSTYESGRAMHV